MNFSRLIVGGLSVVFGFWMFSFVGFVDGPGIDYSGVFTGILFLAFGIYVLLNNREDRIEERKDLNKRKSRR